MIELNFIFYMFSLWLVQFCENTVVSIFNIACMFIGISGVDNLFMTGMFMFWNYIGPQILSHKYTVQLEFVTAWIILSWIKSSGSCFKTF